MLHANAEAAVFVHHSASEKVQTARHSGKETVLTSAWVEAWSIVATDKDVLDSMSSKASSMFS